MLVNIAPLAKVTLSSVSNYSSKDDTQYLLCKKNKIEWDGFSFHTDSEPNPWILLTFPFEFKIARIYVKNRTDMCQDKADSIVIEGELNDELFTVFENREHNWQELNVVLENKFNVNKIKFSLKETNYFHLKEIKVFVEYEEILENFTPFKNKLFAKIYSHLLDFLGNGYIPYINNDLSVIFINEECSTTEAKYKLRLIDSSIQLSFIFDDYALSKNYIISFCKKNDIDLEFFESNIIAYFSKNVEFELFAANFRKFHNAVFLAINTAIYCYVNSKVINADLKSKKTLILDSDLMTRWGFADRFRGILSLINTFDKSNYDIYVKFTNPFNLSKYYLYKDYSMIDDSILKSRHHIFDSLHCNLIPNLDKVDIHEILRKLVDESFESHDCVSIGTNLWYNYSSSTYLNNFTRTNFLCSELLKIKKIIGLSYNTLSFRFLGCLGDFDEPNAKVVSDSEKHNILNKSKDSLIKFVDNHACNKNVLVLSDSVLFLNFIKDIPNVYVFPDNIHHLSSLTNCFEEYNNVYDKILLDFNLIMDAEKAYIAQSNFLYRSGFPLVASCCTGKKLETYSF